MSLNFLFEPIFISMPLQKYNFRFWLTNWFPFSFSRPHHHTFSFGKEVKNNNSGRVWNFTRSFTFFSFFFSSLFLLLFIDNPHSHNRDILQIHWFTQECFRGYFLFRPRNHIGLIRMRASKKKKKNVQRKWTEWKDEKKKTRWSRRKCSWNKNRRRKFRLSLSYFYLQVLHFYSIFLLSFFFFCLLISFIPVQRLGSAIIYRKSYGKYLWNIWLYFQFYSSLCQILCAWVEIRLIK